MVTSTIFLQNIRRNPLSGVSFEGENSPCRFSSWSRELSVLTNKNLIGFKVTFVWTVLYTSSLYTDN